MAKAKTEKIKVTLVKSTIAILPAHKKVVKALGLTKVNSFNVFDKNDAILGMIAKVGYLLKVENV